jgi:hypothetical protein
VLRCARRRDGRGFKPGRFVRVRVIHNHPHRETYRIGIRS